MSQRSFEKLDDIALVEAFSTTAIRLGEAVNYWMPTNNAAKQLLDISRIFRKRGPKTRLLLAPLLDDANRFIQYYAAKHLEGLIPERCRQIIEWNAKQRDAIAGDAGMRIEAVDSGFYKPD
jgi:hypothetical protein